MIFVVATAFWLLTCVLVIRLVRIDRDTELQSRWGTVARVVLLAACVPLFFRPHDLVLSGQDSGVYLNSAAAFARHGSLFHTDPLLKEVPDASRKAFYFGHYKGYGITKDGCLKLKDRKTALVGPRFPPLYPIAMSLLIRIFGPRSAHYVVPLFAVLTVFALGVLGGRLFRKHAAGTLLMLFYALTPVVIWHARAPRPEVIAGFLCLAGISLLLKAWRAEPAGARFDVILAAISFSLAPFFHVTAWFVALPILFWIVSMLLTGRRAALIYPPIALTGVVVYVWHTVTLADQYQLTRILRPLLDREWLCVLLTALLLALPIIIFRTRPRLRASACWREIVASARPAACAALRYAAALLLLIICAWLYLRTQPADQRVFTEYIYHYFYPTDLRMVRVFFSRPVCVLALTGLMLLLCLRRYGRAPLVVVLTLLPHAFLIGNMYDLFMTRYMLIAICPLIAIGLTAIVMSVTLPRRVLRPAIVLCALLICAMLVRNRTSMITTREYRGLSGYVAEFAQHVLAGNGILLSEYPRLAVPIEHFHGVPLLGIDNERQHDYEPALAAWQKVMSAYPSRPAFFLTPFGRPISDRFVFDAVFSQRLHYQRLSAGRYQLPGDATDAEISMTLYAMRPRGTEALRLPFVRQFDGSSMGLQRFSRARTRQWEIQGLMIPPGEPTRIHTAQKIALGSQARMLLFFLAAGENAHPMPTLTPPGAASFSYDWHRLTGSWWVLDVHSEASWQSRELEIMSQHAIMLTGIRLVTANGVTRIQFDDGDGGQAGSATAEFTGRWARSPAKFLAPLAPDREASLLMLLKAPNATGPTTRLTITSRHGRIGRFTVETGLWSWEVLPLPHVEASSGYEWYTLRAKPSWDPELNHYPTDLAARLGCIAIIEHP